MARHLPGPEQQYRLAERKSLGFNKASRSGAFSKPGTGYAYFPNGLKFASDFIDEHTPGKYKPADKPYEHNVPMVQKQDIGNVPKPAFMDLETCIACLKPINLKGNKEICDHKALDCECFTPNLGFIFEQEQLKLWALGLQFGDPIVTNFHTKCFNEYKGFNQQTLPVVRGGGLLSPKQQRELAEYKGVWAIHDGQETTMGRVNAYDRLELIAKNTQQHIIRQRQSGNMALFREDRR
jgi:hypothetical protein